MRRRDVADDAVIPPRLVLEAAQHLLDLGVSADEYGFAKADPMRVRLSHDEIDRPAFDDERSERECDELGKERERDLDVRRKNGNHSQHHGGEPGTKQQTTTVATCVARPVSAVGVETDQCQANEGRPDSRPGMRRDRRSYLCREDRGAEHGHGVEDVQCCHSQHLSHARNEQASLRELASYSDIIWRKREHPVWCAPRHLDVSQLDDGRLYF